MGHPELEDLTTMSNEVEDMSKGKVEASHNKHVAGDSLLVANGNVRQIPAPTNNPNDPLNFSRFVKFGIVLSCCWFSSMSLVTISGLGGVLGVFFGMYIPQGYSSTQVVSLATVPTLCIGLGNFIILPATMIFGRRPVFLAASAVTLATTLWAALQNSWESHMAARVLMGFATGATESLLPLIITDVTFISERSLYFGLYWGIQNISSAGLSIAATYEVAALGWRWYYFVLAIMTGVGLVLTFFLGFETRFDRPPTYIDGQVIVVDAFGATHILSEEEARERLAHEPQENRSIDMDIQKKTYMQQIKPFDSVTPNGPRVALNSLIAMVRSLTSPGVVFAVFAAAISLGVGVSVTLTYDALLQKGYGWSAGSVGLVNIGPLISAFLAMGYAGWFGDKSIILQAKRNNGVHLPEHHLVNLIFPGITGIIGLMVYAVSAQYPERYSWVAPLGGWTVYQFSFISTMIITTTFAAEAFPKSPGSSLVVVVGSKNILAFAASYGLVPMVHMYDYMTAFSILAGIFAFIFLCGIPVYFINPRWRKSFTKKEELKKQRNGTPSVDQSV